MVQDPLSVLGAHVGRTVFQQVFMNNPEGRNVANALHCLPQVDYIFTTADGQIMEHGIYTKLMANRNSGDREYRRSRRREGGRREG